MPPASNQSILTRLKVGFAVITVVGSTSMMIVEFMNFEYLFGYGRERLGTAAIVHELFEHVLIPAIFILIPLFIATLWALRRSLSPLQEAVAAISDLSDNKRGLRIIDDEMPRELLPFVDAVNSLLQRLDDTAARQEAFAADVAHELRTPLAVLALELGNLRDARAADLKQEVQKMSHMVEQLLLMAQIDADSAAPLPMEPTNVGAVAEDVVAKMAPLAIEHGKKLALKRIEEVTVMARPENLERAIRNIVENGLKATPAKGRVKVIVGPGAQLRVRDEGSGLSAEDLRKMTERFVRADRNSSGVGLGLAIASKIMRLHGGTIETDPQAREIILRFPSP